MRPLSVEADQSSSYPTASSIGPSPRPRLGFFFFAGYTFAATGGANVSCTNASIPLQYFTSGCRADDTVCRIRQYQSDHSSSFLFLFLIAASIRVTSEKGGIQFPFRHNYP